MNGAPFGIHLRNARHFDLRTKKSPSAQCMGWERQILYEGDREPRPLQPFHEDSLWSCAHR